jgi:hypothetical protein
MSQAKISLGDVETKLRSLQEGIEGKVEDRKQTLLAVGAGVGVVVLLLFFLLGRRSGKHRSAIVEIRRV